MFFNIRGLYSVFVIDYAWTLCELKTYELVICEYYNACLVSAVALEVGSKNLALLHVYFSRDSHIITAISRKRYFAGVLPTTW